MKKTKLAAIISLMFLLIVNLNNIVYAASEELNLPDNIDPQKIDQPSVFSLFIKLIISLVIIVILAYYSMKFLRRNFQSKAEGDSVSILDQHALGVNKGIYITEIGDKVYVLGVTDHNVNLLTEISDQEFIVELRDKAQQRQNEPIVPTNIVTFVQNLVLNFKKKNTIPNQGKDFKSHIQTQVNKLQSMFSDAQGEGKDED